MRTMRRLGEGEARFTGQNIHPPTRSPSCLQRAKTGKPITIIESGDMLRYGFARFQERIQPTRTQRCQFRRVAGNIFEPDDAISRREMKRMLGDVKEEGIVLVLGHGGHIKCGAVAAKQKHLDRGLDTHEKIVHIIDHIPDSVKGLRSPEAEDVNARHQAGLLLDDKKLGGLIRDKNLTVVTGICTASGIDFSAINRRNLSNGNLTENYPVLRSLNTQMKNALRTVHEGRRNLTTHTAHVMFSWDPEEMKNVMGQDKEQLELVGICCVDARLPPRVPGPRYIFGTNPGEALTVTCSINGKTEFTTGELGSAIYGLTHVQGLAPELKTEHDGHMVTINGNGHILAFASDMDTANMIKHALLEEPAVANLTKDGKTISIGYFDGQRLVIRNGHAGLTINERYQPVVPIL